VMISGFFSAVLPKDTKVSEIQEFRHSYYRLSSDPSDLESITTQIMCYRGLESDPRWLDEDSSMYSTLCYVTADTSQLPNPPKTSQDGRSTYHRIKFDVIMSFGLTELKAQIAWVENGVEKRSPAQIIYDEVINDD